jgi:RHS repeat-associated protein
LGYGFFGLFSILRNARAERIPVKSKTFTTDSLGRMTLVEEPGGLNTSYEYNSLGQLKTVTMVRGSTTQIRSFSYDSLGRMSSSTHPERGTVAYSYNADGTVEHKTDAKGQKVAYEYDYLKRLSTVRRYPDGTVESACQRTEFTYDERTVPDVTWGNELFWGQMTEASVGSEGCTHGRISEQYSYDLAGRPLIKRMLVERNAAGGIVDTGKLDHIYGWDAEGKLALENYPNSGPSFTMSYDSMGRPTTLTRTSPSLTLAQGATYNVAGQLTGVTYNLDTGFTESRSYNELQQLTQISVPGAFQETYTFEPGKNNGRIWKSTVAAVGGWAAEELTYEYDLLNRLTAVKNGSTVLQDYAFDGFSNLTKIGAASWTVNPSNNRRNDMSYDANGNQTTAPVPRTAALQYDVENRVVRNGFNGREYAYDPYNRRVIDGSGNTKVYVFWSVDGRVVGRYQESGAGSGVITFATLETRAYFGGRLIAESVGISTNWTRVVTDRLGSVRVRGAGAAEVRYKYWPYGEERPGEQGPGDQTKFGTYWREAGTGLDYANQRYYMAGRGRFLTPDPSEAGDPSNPGSLNLYGDVHGDPINAMDPAGLDVDRIDINYGNEPTCLGRFMTTISSAPNAWLNSDVGTLALQVWFEFSTNMVNDFTKDMWKSMANVYRNRWLLTPAQKSFQRFDPKANFKRIIYASAGHNWWNPRTQAGQQSHWNADGKLKAYHFNDLKRAFNSPPNERLCNALIESFNLSRQVYGNRSDDPTRGSTFYAHSWFPQAPPGFPNVTNIANPYGFRVNPFIRYVTTPTLFMTIGATTYHLTGWFYMPADIGR